MRMAGNVVYLPYFSSVMEEALVRQRLGERWLSENREAIASYNEHVEAHGVFSDGVRAF